MMRIALSFVVSAACSKTPNKVVLGQPVHPFGVVSNVWLGMSKDEVKQKAPQLEPNNGKPDTEPNGDGTWRASPEGANYGVRFKDGHVVAIEMQLMKRSEADLWKAWGGPGVAFDSVFERSHFFDPERGARADVSVVAHGESFAVTIQPMVTYAKLLGEGPDATSFAGVRIIGRSAKEVADDFTAHHFEVHLYSSQDTQHGTVSMPPTEWTRGDSTDIAFDAKADGIVGSWALMSSMDNVPEAKVATLAAYEHKWGKPTKDEHGALVYGHNPTIMFEPETLGIWVMPIYQ
jgi:hypothetical protein